MDGLTQTLQRLGPARLAAMAMVTALLIGFFGFISLKVSKAPMIALYSELSFTDSTGIIEYLEGQSIEYELRGNGSTVLIPADMVLRTRMALAGEGLPTGGSVGYEIFDKSSTLGTTSFVQNVNHVRALEGELSRTIKAITLIQAARVHLVIPERQLFRAEKNEPSASIALRVRGTLDMSQIRSIQHLVASAVDGLKPSRVSIVDDTGHLLASGNEPDGIEASASMAEERASKIERRLQTQISDIVSSVVGAGRARVQVNADLDLNRVTQTSDIYDPQGQVVRSTQSRSDESAANEQAGSEGVSVGNELPSANADSDTTFQRQSENTAEEVVNYEISKTTTTQVTEAGGLKRLSVAVLVDGVYTSADDGTLTYAPRSEEDLEQIATLVRSAVGFSEARGDTVQVVNMRFAEAPEIGEVEFAEEGAFSFSREEYFRIAELVVMALLTLIVLFLVVRPMLKKVLESSEILPTNSITQMGPALDAEGNPLPMQISADGKVSGGALPPGVVVDSEMARQIEAAKANGAVRAEVITKVGKMVEENPTAATDIIRSMVQEAA